MNFKKFHVSKNLFDYSTVTTGYRIQWITGDDYPDDTAVRSDYISVNSGTYSCSDSVIVLGYDANKDYLGATNGDGVFEKIAKIPISQFTVPTNSLCKYIKILAFNSSVPMNIDAETMLNTGSTPQPYEPYSSEVWHDIPHYIHNTSTDTLTTLPADIYANDNNATVGLKGNMEQSGTPTPTTPIQPQECGERTNNLFDVSTATLGKYIDSNGNEVTSTAPSPIEALNHTDYIEIQPNTNYTYHYKYSNGAINTIALCWFDASKNLISRNTKNVYVQDKEYTLTGTSPANAAFCIINFVGYLPNASMELSFNSGTTPLPYEPYGIKIPILNNSQTTNVYLGEVESTRRIKKYEFTGTEALQTSGSGNTRFFYLSIADARSWAAIIGDRYVNANISSTSEDIGIAMSGNSQFRIRPDLTSTVNDFKSYLAQQYAAGTPVTVWYVLTTPTTGIVNEPLRKIGDYADTVSDITIPTIAGVNAVDVLTTLKPSEVTATYKGWHPVQSVHERESGQWD